MDYVTDQLGTEADRPERLEIKIASTTSLDKYPAKQHAKRVAHNLRVSHGLIYLPGAATVLLEDSDQAQPFRQRRYFYYLSGVDEPDCHLTYDIARDELILYVPEITPKKVVWSGRGSNVTEALERYDIDNAFYAPDLIRDVDKWTEQHKEGKIYILHPSQAVRPGDDFSDHVDYWRLGKAIDGARVIKDEHEIQLIKKANEVSGAAHAKVLRAVKELSNEREVDAIFLRECIARGAKNQAYNIIAASGENAAVLHYSKNDEPLEGRQLMCLDAGAEWNCYASDVTRTFPLSGRWPSEESKNIYQLVQDMQETCIRRLAPGVRFVELHVLAHKIAIDGLLKLGLLHNGTAEEILMIGTSAAFFPHGLGHHVGLEVHDVSPASAIADRYRFAMNPVDEPWSYIHLLNTEDKLFGEGKNIDTALLQPNAPALEEGMVVTVEPGIYFSRFALEEGYFNHPVHSRFINKEVVQRYLPVGGVRIEDDILITKSGHENLTVAPKDVSMFFHLNSLPGSDAMPARQRTGRQFHGSAETGSQHTFHDLSRDNRETRRRADPLPQPSTSQPRPYGKFPLAQMNGTRAQLTIEEALRRLEKLRVNEDNKDSGSNETSLI
ncbi:MAG: hypothetical protein M1821_005639 [Bathelium mastoideum]|nr:MAG: hypothetical protein M1821_005639 [Bathelium mastoideum]KAI9680436.1 MAG: hypothetical protein M1822_007194 [Bathelium mastoideum]